MVRQIRCVLMRGGTSKAVFLRESDLPVDEAERTFLSLAAGTLTRAALHEWIERHLAPWPH